MDVLLSVGHAGGFPEAGLKKQITVDMSSPVVGGKTMMQWLIYCSAQPKGET